ncbi:MAG: queuosine precursor transporter [Chlamydiota bacterium]
MNETLFFVHVFLVLGFVLAALRLGKEALIVWIVLQAILANFFVLKQMLFFGFNVTCSDVFVIGSIVSLNLLQEYFGKESARKALWISFFALLFYTLMSQIHLLYTPSNNDTTHTSFTQLLNVAPRLLVASMTTFFIVQKLDIHLFNLLKKVFPTTPFAIRSFSSLIIMQLLDTALFSYLGLYGLGFALSDIIIISFLLKLLIIACTLPINLFARRLHHEI